MEIGETIKEITETVEHASTDFEKTNTDLKRKYLIWNIEAFNIIASKVKTSKGSFGTGYPFYVLDENLEGELPIIPEQIRYNRQLIIDGEPVKDFKWMCKECIQKKYANMPNLKKICRPCPNVIDPLKPRKVINRLPDMDMWMVCEDENIEEGKNELIKLLEENGMHSSDIDPIMSIKEVSEIAEDLKNGKIPKKFLPMDIHIMQYSELKSLIEKVPEELKEAKRKGVKPYLPIQPISYRKEWQYDDEAYNFIYDYLSAFTSFNFESELQKSLDRTRKVVASNHTPEELFGFLLDSATRANFRRLQTPELETCFLKRIETWNNLNKHANLEESKEKKDESR